MKYSIREGLNGGNGFFREDEQIGEIIGTDLILDSDKGNYANIVKKWVKKEGENLMVQVKEQKKANEVVEKKAAISNALDGIDSPKALDIIAEVMKQQAESNKKLVEALDNKEKVTINALTGEDGAINNAKDFYLNKYRGDDSLHAKVIVALIENGRNPIVRTFENGRTVFHINLRECNNFPMSYGLDIPDCPHYKCPLRS